MDQNTQKIIEDLIEDRLANLEKDSTERLASLERQVKELQQELAKRRTLEGLRTDVQDLQVRYQAHEEYVTERLNDFEGRITTRMNVLEDNLAGKLEEQAAHIDGLEGTMNARFQEWQQGQQEFRAGQTALQAGQEQILAILTRQTKTNE